MKIAFLNKYLPSDEPCGVSVQVHRLANALEKKKHSVTVFSFSPPPLDALYTSVQLSWGRKHPAKWLSKIIPAWHFRRLDLKEFDIVHYHGDDYLSIGSERRVRTFYGSALQEAIHARTISRFLYQALFYIFELVSCVRKGTSIAISRNSLRSLPGVHLSIPCGIELDKYRPADSKSPSPTIVFIGDLFGRKRGMMLLDIFSKQIVSAIPDCVLKVIGSQSCSGKNVQFMGRVSEYELVKVLQSAWIYCMPSSYEGFGVPALEAMACGTVVVATPNCGIREIINPGKTGIISTDRNLGKDLIKVISDYSLRQDIIANALKEVQNFDMHCIAAQYEAVYNRIKTDE